jgi:SAM-dependent methyltransferase
MASGGDEITCGRDGDAEALSLAEDARLRFEALYERGAHWDVPHPQPAIVELAERGMIGGRVLDAGCGTGENALYLAQRGLDVWGIDVAPSAIGQACAKARARGLPAARFLVGDALRPGEFGLAFDTVIDSGLFHALTDRGRDLYVAGLHSVAVPGGLCHLLCFSDAQPGEEGPRRVSEAELRAAFSAGWRWLELRRTRFVTRAHNGGAHAWRASLERCLT